jgi:hypothetical protein
MTAIQKPILKPVASMYTPDITYTYPGKLNLELIKPIRLGTPALSDLFTIIQGVRCGEYLHYVNPLSRVLAKPSGDCNPTYTQAGSITDRRLETGEFQINLEWCEAEFSAVCTALVEKYTAAGVDGYELQSNLQSIIFEEVLEAARIDVLKAMFFSDNSLGAGNTSIYSTIDGVFTKFFDSETAYCVKPVSNALPNGHDSTLAADQARDTFRALWSGAEIELKQLPTNQKAFWVTGSMWENYYDSLLNNCCVEGSWRAGQDGITTLYYRGIEVLPLWFADESLSSETANPFYDEIRHFAVYTAKANHYMGVERSSDLNNLTSCFDCRTNSTLIKGRMRFGYNFAQCGLIAWAK